MHFFDFFSQNAGHTPSKGIFIPKKRGPTHSGLPSNLFAPIANFSPVRLRKQNYNSSSKWSETRIRPQYSQMIIFLPWRISL